MKFQNETIDNSTYLYDKQLRIFMEKHSQQCWTNNWNSQNLGILSYSKNKWKATFTTPTITASDFLKKYDKKRLSFKTIF